MHRELEVFQEYLDLIRELLESREPRVLSLIFEVIIMTSIDSDCGPITYAFFSERLVVPQVLPFEFEAPADQVDLIFHRLDGRVVAELAVGEIPLQGYLLSSEANRCRVS